MKLNTALAAATFLVLGACGGGSQADIAADQLENAADQSDPAAAAVLENAADEVREGGDPAAAQNALQQAGNAQASTVPTEQPVPPSVQAAPNRTGQRTPPPKVPAAPASGNSQ